MRTDIAPDRPPPTDEEIRLGTRTQAWVNRVTLACIAISLAAIAFVITQVPLDTTVTYNRLSSEFQMPIFAMLAIPAILTVIWLRSRRPDAGVIDKKERYILIIFASIFLGFCLIGQFILVNAFLVAGNA
jgi:hypothetical protein